MDAVKKWVYKPTLLNGHPVEVITRLELNFALSEPAPALFARPAAFAS